MKYKITDLLKKLYLFWPFILVALSGLLIIFQYKHDELYYYWDQYFPLNINEALRSYSYVWHNESGFGNYDIGSLNRLVYIILIKIISLFCTNIYTTQKIFYYLVFCCSGLSFYYLLNIIFKKNSSKILIFAAIFYSINIFSLIYIWRMNLNSIFLYSFLPLAFGAFLSMLEKINYRNIILICLSFILMIPAFGHPAYIIIIGFLFGFYSVFRSVFDRNFKPIKYFFIGLVLWLLFNSWWLYPMIANAENILESSGNNSISDAIMIYYTTGTYSTWQNVVRLLGEWHLYDYHFGVKDFPWLTNYTATSVYSILLYIIPVSVLMAIFLKQTTDHLKRDKIFFIILFLISSIFIIGPNSIENVFTWLFNNNVFFRMFRNSYEKTGILLAMSSSFIFAYLTTTISTSTIKRKIKTYLIVALYVILLVIIPLPFYLNKIYPTGNNYLPSSMVTIPNEYPQIGKLLNKDEKTFVFPFQNSPLQSIDDGQKKYIGPDMLRNLTMYPIISTESGISSNDQISKNLSYNLEYSNDKDYINKIFGFFGINKLLNDPNVIDLSKISDGVYTPYNRKIAAALPIINKVANIDLYDVKKDMRKPEIYVAKNPVYLLSDKVDDIFNLLKYEKPDNIYLANATNKKLNNLPTILVLDPSNAKLSKDKLFFNLSNFIDGEYNFRLGLTDDSKVQNKTINSLKINNEEIAISAKQNESFLDVGNFQIDKNSNLEVKTTFENINLSNSDFEKGLWQCIDTTPASMGKPDFNCSQSLDSNSGHYSAKLFSKNHRLGMRQKIELDKEKTYEISFSYKYASGTEPYFVIEYLDPKNEYSISEKKYYLNQSRLWENYKVNFQPMTGEVFLYFYADPSYGQSEIYIDDVNLKKIDIGLIKNIIVSSVNQNKINLDNLPNIVYNKINPTKYEIDVKNAKDPFFINLLQTYDKNWKLFVGNDKKPVNEGNHYLSDGYANSWLIYQKGSYKITIEFVTQKRVAQILYTLVFLLISCLLAYLFIKLKKRHN